MSRKMLLVGAAAVLLAAPSLEGRQVPAAQPDDPAITQVFLYEMALRSAVEVAPGKQ